jgi:hypothetical protein
MPALYDVITYQDQRFVCIELVPYQAPGKLPSVYSNWEAECAELGCATTFVQSFPPAFPTVGVKMSRRCPEHAKPGVPIIPRTRGPAPRTVRAAELLCGWLREHPMTTTAVSALVGSRYGTMDEETARVLGSHHKTPYVCVLRVLRAAAWLKMATSERDKESRTLMWSAL